MEKRLIWAGYLFIAGVASGFAVFSDFDAYKPFLFNLSLINILLSVLLSGGILLAARLLKSMTLFWIVLLLTVFSAGLYRYLQANSLGEVHITDFLDDSFWANTEIVGDVIKEPSIRENKIYLLIRPVKLKKEKEKEWRDIPPKAGNVMVSIFPTVGEYYNNCDYGDRLWFKGALVEPFTATNPTGFDYRRYLKRIFQAYATMSVKRPVNIEKRGSGGNWFIRWVLRLKWKMLASIKRTMPYPESAFLGGVTLGSRAGVPLYMRFQFQSTGIAHVLAVSGLHAGFAAALALAFCSILRLVRVKKFVVMVFSLLVFAIITGASPATTRSCLMLTIGLFLHTFANMGIKASTRMTIPVSAIILLAVNPLYLPEGSFVLSYAAVWSLAHLTDPVRAFFQRYIKGWSFISFFFSLFFVLSIFIIKPEVALGQQDVLYRYLMILFIVNLFAYHVLERFFPLEGLNLDEIHKLPFCSYLIDFFYAQGAIQLGMNAVLSMVFFGKYSLSGTLANYIAIPLIGVCVQMGLITSLLDVVLKSIGLGQIGYVLATFAAMGNYWWCHLFLKVAEFFYNLYPYPYTLAPNTLELILFYAFIVSLALYEEVSELFLKVPWARIVYAALFIVPLGFNFWGNVMKEKGKAEFTFFDLSFGQGTLIRSPNGKYFLVDGGGSFIHSEDIPLTLGKYRIKELEGIILTNPRPENIGNMGTPPGGLLAVLSGYKVKNFYSAVPEEVLKPHIKYEEFLKSIADWRLLDNPSGKEPQEIYDSFYPLVKLIKEKGVIYKRLSAGDVVWKEESGGKEFVIRILHPGREPVIGTGSDLDNNSVVLRVEYGDVQLLIPSLLRSEGEYHLVRNLSPELLKSRIMLASSHGWQGANTEPFLDAVRPEVIVAQYGYGKGFSNFFFESELKFKEKHYEDAKVYLTERDGGVIVNTDGKTYKIKTVMEAKKGRRADEEAGERAEAK